MAFTATVTPQSIEALRAVTAGPGPGARRESWPAQTFQVPPGKSVQGDSPFGLVAHRGCNPLFLQSQQVQLVDSEPESF